MVWHGIEEGTFRTMGDEHRVQVMRTPDAPGRLQLLAAATGSQDWVSGFQYSLSEALCLQWSRLSSAWNVMVLCSGREKGHGLSGQAKPLRLKAALAFTTLNATRGTV